MGFVRSMSLYGSASLLCKVYNCLFMSRTKREHHELDARAPGSGPRLCSGDDVGGQEVLDLGDLVLQGELLALQAADDDEVGEWGQRQGLDRGVEVGVVLEE